MLTIKEYAMKSNKAVQSVYRQMKGKDNSRLLEKHVFVKKVNGKPVKFLDDEAVAILDESSKQSVTVIEKENQNERIEAQEKEIEVWKNKVILLQEKMTSEILKRDEEIKELRSENKMLLEDKVALLEDKEPTKKWYHFWK